ncbi:hypothetical protein BDQ17DRAFT_1258996, partial [Cyathus striatus]
VYDYLLTFDLEVNFIWNALWSTLKVLYMLTQYLPFLDTMIAMTGTYLSLLIVMSLTNVSCEH